MPSASGRARKARFGHLQRDTRQHMQRTTRSGGRRSKPTRLLLEQHGGGPSTAKRRGFVEGPQQQLKSAQILQGHRAPVAAKKASRGEGSACLFLFLFFLPFLVLFCSCCFAWFSFLILLIYLFIFACFCSFLPAGQASPPRDEGSRVASQLELRREKQKVLKGRRAETEPKREIKAEGGKSAGFFWQIPQGFPLHFPGLPGHQSRRKP